VTRGALAAALAASFLLLAVGTAQATQFTNTTPITITDSPLDGTVTPATPSPSPILVAGQSGVVKSVEVTVSGFHHTGQKDVDILLQAPSGQVVTLLSDLGARAGGNPTVDLGFRTGAASFPTPGTGCANNGTLVSGFFAPTDNDDPSLDCNTPTTSCVGDPGLDANNTSLEAFNETDPNGTWKLFVSDDCHLDLGSSTGWALDLTTGPPIPPPNGSPGPTPTPPGQSTVKKKCKKKKHRRSAVSAKKKCKHKKR
jgi:subtilisin-like proprotein convertase family protein